MNNCTLTLLSKECKNMPLLCRGFCLPNYAYKGEGAYIIVEQILGRWCCIIAAILSIDIIWKIRYYIYAIPIAAMTTTDWMSWINLKGGSEGRWTCEGKATANNDEGEVGGKDGHLQSRDKKNCPFVKVDGFPRKWADALIKRSNKWDNAQIA